MDTPSPRNHQSPPEINHLAEVTGDLDETLAPR
jgi:hypothetical protein